MDWIVATRLAEALTAGDAGEAERLRQAWAQRDPALLSTAESLATRSGLATSFLQTSASEGASFEQLATGTRVGVWRIEAVIGAGGMGVVYRGHRDDGAFAQTVALKVLHRMEAQAAVRFAVERQRLAQMDHPGVSRIIDGGEDAQGRAYLAMELVEGAPIDQFAREARLSSRARAALVRTVCAAVAHAHARLILHRDIKPSNVLVDANGHPRLIDFGISTSLSGDGGDDGALTLAYAAPEQLAGAPQAVTTDVFGLGALLHALLTGAPPGRRSDGGVTVDEARIDDRDLSAIVARATATDPAERYATAEALAGDVDAYLTSRSVAARAGGPLYAAGKFVRRHAVPVALGLALVVTLAGGFAATVLALGDAERARADTERQLALSDFFAEQRQTTANLLQDVVRSFDQTEAFEAFLLERWREAHASADDEPDAAALVSYSIGREFLFRNDYQTSFEILDAWLTSGYGTPQVRGYGELLLPIAMGSVGLRQESLAVLRENLRFVKGTALEGTATEAAVLIRIAEITGTDEDIIAALAFINALRARGEVGPQNMQFLLNKTANLHRLRGDFDAMAVSFEDLAAVLDANRVNKDTSQDTTLMLVLAENALFVRDDPAAAQTGARAAIAAVEAYGEGGSATEAQAMTLLAEAALMRGDCAEAADLAADAFHTATPFVSAATTSVQNARAAHIEALACLGDWEGLKASEVAHETVAPDDMPTSPRERVRLAYALANTLAAQAGEPPPFAQAQEPTREPARINPRLAWGWTRLDAVRGQSD